MGVREEDLPRRKRQRRKNLPKSLGDINGWYIKS